MRSLKTISSFCMYIFEILECRDLSRWWNAIEFSNHGGALWKLDERWNRSENCCQPELLSFSVKPLSTTFISSILNHKAQNQGIGVSPLFIFIEFVWTCHIGAEEIALPNGGMMYPSHIRRLLSRSVGNFFRIYMLGGLLMLGGTIAATHRVLAVVADASVWEMRSISISGRTFTKIRSCVNWEAE